MKMHFKINVHCAHEKSVFEAKFYSCLIVCYSFFKFHYCWGVVVQPTDGLWKASVLQFPGRKRTWPQATRPVTRMAPYPSKADGVRRGSIVLSVERNRWGRVISLGITLAIPESTEAEPHPRCMYLVLRRLRRASRALELKEEERRSLGCGLGV